MTSSVVAIRQGTEADLATVLAWLFEEEQTYEQRRQTRGFWCNRDPIGRAQTEGRFWVMLGADDMPLAFAVIDLGSIEYLEVHPSYRRDPRRLGLGRLLADRMIGVLRHANFCSVSIQCKPVSSVPFWRSLGFTIHGVEAPTGLLLLDRVRQLPEGGPSAEILVRAFPGSADWDRATASVAEWSPPAAWKDESRSTITLAKRVILSREALGLPQNEDLVVEIVVGGVLLKKSKAKHMVAFGVKNDRAGTFYIDEVCLSS